VYRAGERDRLADDYNNRCSRRIPRSLCCHCRSHCGRRRAQKTTQQHDTRFTVQYPPVKRYNEFLTIKSRQ